MGSFKGEKLHKPAELTVQSCLSYKAMIGIELSIDTIYGGMYEQEICSVSRLNATDETPNYGNFTDFKFVILRLRAYFLFFFLGAGILSGVNFG